MFLVVRQRVLPRPHTARCSCAPFSTQAFIYDHDICAFLWVLLFCCFADLLVAHGAGILHLLDEKLHKM